MEPIYFEANPSLLSEKVHRQLALPPSICQRFFQPVYYSLHIRNENEEKIKYSSFLNYNSVSKQLGFGTQLIDH